MTENTPNTAHRTPPAPLTVPEVAKALRVSDATIRNWIAQGTILSIRAGRQYRIPASELDRLLTPHRRRVG